MKNNEAVTVPEKHHATLTMPSDREIMFSRTFNAPRELVFHAWTDPVQLGRWWGPQGFTVTTHHMEVKPGGSWRLTMHGPDGTDYKNRIVFLEVETPHRLVYKHAGEEGDEPAQFQVTVTFDGDGDRTHVTMRMLFRSAEERDYVIKTYGADKGGIETLERLAGHLAHITLNHVSIHRYFESSAERVFDAWLDPKIAGKWLFTTQAGIMQSVQIDARIGGKYSIIERRDGIDMDHIGEYLEIIRPERLVFTFGSSHFPDTLVMIDIRPLEKGCELTLTHLGVWPDYVERTKSGWGVIMDNLAALLGDDIKS